MHDLESMRSAAGYPASLMSYFTNSALDKHLALDNCMVAMAEKVTLEINAPSGLMTDVVCLDHERIY